MGNKLISKEYDVLISSDCKIHTNELLLLELILMLCNIINLLKLRNFKLPMRSFMMKYVLVLGIFLICSCSSDTKTKHDKEVTNALFIAGNNRYEIEKVIDHYEKYLCDSLKLKAAYYLINQMKGHDAVTMNDDVPIDIKNSFEKLHSHINSTYYLNSDINSFDFVDTFNKVYNDYDYDPAFQKIDSFIRIQNNPINDGLTPQFNSAVSKIRELLVTNSINDSNENVTTEDLKNIHAEYLIDHIDNAFKLWKESPFTKRMNFKEFEQTLLPFRQNKEPIGDFSSLYRNLFYNILHSRDSSNLEEVVRRFTFYLYSVNIFKKDETQFGNAGLYDILQWESLKCGRRTQWSAKVLNSCGIPTAIDFTPSFINKVRGLHYWISVRDTLGEYHPFNPYWQLLNDTAYFKRTSKVYRLSYSVNENSPAILKQGSEWVPEIFSSPFINDVTEEYHSVVDITLPINEKSRDRQLGYLAIFNPKGWEIVSWGEIDKKQKTITFQNIPVNVVYFPVSWGSESFIPTHSPFFVSSDGRMKKVILDNGPKQDMLLTRKSPKRDKLIQRMLEMSGSSLQASNKEDFSDAVTLHTLSERDLSDMTVTAININEKRKFRYVRCIPEKGKMINIAIMEVYSKSQEGQEIKEGTQPYILSPTERLLNRNGSLSLINSKPLGSNVAIKNVSDGKMETYFVGYSVALDLGEKMEIDQIRIAPRNANNGIVKGNRYELKYYVNSTWVSAGIKIAMSNYLQYYSVPSNTIYWLRNLDRGKEELAFLYKNGRQIFINNDNISEIVQ